MIKIENFVLPSAEQWKAIIMGCRNPLNSWSRSDSHICMDCEHKEQYCVGLNDLDLMTRLRNAGTDHRKFMRMITVYVDITAPRYWWAEADTYKIGTVRNSCSTMHKIAAKEFTWDDFSTEHLKHVRDCSLGDVAPTLVMETVIDGLNFWRKRYLDTKSKDDWWQMIQLLPGSYNQKATLMLNYEVLANIYKSRRNHKLDEWHMFCDWVETLPYSELITGKTDAAT